MVADVEECIYNRSLKFYKELYMEGYNDKHIDWSANKLEWIDEVLLENIEKISQECIED